MVATALFDIDDDGEDDGFEGAVGQTLTIRLRAPIDSGVNHVRFQVFDPAGFDPTAGIAANPPLASKGAPTLTLNGATSGQNVSPTTVGGSITVTLPGTNGHSWLVRCVVNGGKRLLSDGTVVTDPLLIHHRGIYIKTTQGTRKIVATELFEFDPGGWADAVNDLILLGGAPLSTFQPSGTGAFVRQIDGYLNEGISALSFMNDAARLAAVNATMAVDHRAALQAAIDYAIYRNGNNIDAPGPKVHLGGAVFRSDGPIHVGYGVDFRSVIVEGEGKRFGGVNHSRGSGTCIVFTHTNAPGIVVQGGRNVQLRNFAIVGENYDHCVGLIQTPTMDNIDLDTWVGPGVSNERYRPYVGVAIDPYAGVRPGASYPDVTYPAWLGAVPQYGKEGSSATELHNIDIRGFVGAIGQQTCDYDGNADYTKLRGVSASFCAYGMTWGNSQSRVMRYDGCTFVAMHTGMISGTHGRQQGKPTVTLTDCEFSVIIAVYDIPTLSFAEGPIFIGCFGEAMYSLGKVDGAQFSGGISFKSCEWGFTLWDTYGVPAVVHDQQQAKSLARFENVSFFNPTGRGYLHFKGEGSDGSLEGARNFEFSGCVSLVTGLTQRFEKCAYNGTLGVVIFKGSTCVQRYSFRSGDLHNLDTGASIDPTVFTEWNRGNRTRCLNVYTRYAKSLAFGNDPGVPVAWRNWGIGATTVTSQVGRIVTFVFAGADTSYLMVVGGDVGDVIICNRTKASFVVQARTGDSITARAESGFNAAGNLLMPLVDGDEFDTVNCRRYMPGAALYGNITAGSPIITNVVEGGGGFPADIGAHVAAGDFIYCDHELDRFIFPYSAAILSFDNVAHTITFATNFEQTRTRMRLGPFVRLPMPNAA